MNTSLKNRVKATNSLIPVKRILSLTTILKSLLKRKEEIHGSIEVKLYPAMQSLHGAYIKAFNFDYFNL